MCCEEVGFISQQLDYRLKLCLVCFMELSSNVRYLYQRVSLFPSLCVMGYFPSFHVRSNHTDLTAHKEYSCLCILLSHTVQDKFKAAPWWLVFLEHRFRSCFWLRLVSIFVLMILIKAVRVLCMPLRGYEYQGVELERFTVPVEVTNDTDWLKLSIVCSSKSELGNVSINNIFAPQSTL